MSGPDHIILPDPHAGPFGGLSDDDLAVAYERVAADPDSQVAPMILAEMRHRGLVE